jgi:bisphosphoglycerate-independent phosphoglycerate mutase (AlkP superfamily)
MAQATKSPEAVKSSVVVKSPMLEQAPEVVANLGESLLNTWSESIDNVCEAQKKLEDQFLQALENQVSQKELFGKLNEEIARIEDEQKKFYNNFLESTKQNLSKAFGESQVEQYFAQFDGVSNFLQELTAKSYKESLNFVSQSQEQFKETVQSSFEQQQKIREEFKNQIKTTQELYVDIFEKNTKAFLSLFK